MGERSWTLMNKISNKHLEIWKCPYSMLLPPTNPSSGTLFFGERETSALLSFFQERQINWTPLKRKHPPFCEAERYKTLNDQHVSPLQKQWHSQFYSWTSRFFPLKLWAAQLDDRWIRSVFQDKTHPLLYQNLSWNHLNFERKAFLNGFL